jgi:uncharacterized protein (DUF885 family)
MTLPITRRSALALASSVALAPLVGCSPGKKDAVSATVAGPSEADANFARLSKAWMDAVLKANPASATVTGEHKYDAEFDDVSEAGRAARAGIVKETTDALKTIDRAKLSRDNQVDAAMLAEALEAETFSLDTNKDWSWDPLIYSNTGSGALYGLMAREFKPIEERLISAASRMEKLPDFLAQVRKTLVAESVPEIHAQTYSGQNGGTLSIIDDLILPAADKLGPDDRKRLMAAAEKAKAAVAAHQTWIDKELIPKAKGDYKLGARYDAKLRYSINEATPKDELRKRAEANAATIREEMLDIAKGVLAAQPGAKPLPATLDDKQKLATIAAAFAIAAKMQPPRDKLFDEARRTLDEATAYVRDHNIITLPDAPVKVQVMPKFEQGVAVANCDSPGPLDNKLDTFFNISPIPKEWTDKQTKSFLSEYNAKMLYELSVHEAMPGHYVQIWHANKNPSILRAFLASGSFVEGWACYAEDMMIEQGFGADDPLRRLTNLKMRLRSTTNAILDQGVHVDGWDKDKAMDFMTREGFQEEREANGKWTRARVSSGQLASYFVGMTGHWALRKDAQAKDAAGFNLKAYHDAALSHGSPPVRFVRELMFNEAIV